MHSDFSHDGHQSLEEIARELKRRAIDFCVLTDHFEDFDGAAYSRYIAEAERINEKGEIVLVPAVEAEFGQFHIIFLQAEGYDSLKETISRGVLPGPPVLAFLAHPRKYPLASTAAFLKENQLDGVELWNQQSDGSYAPPSHLLSQLHAAGCDFHSVFFGCDIHNVEHRLKNLLLIPRGEPLTPASIVQSLQRGEFLNYNQNRGRSLSGNASAEAIEKWLDALKGERNLKVETVERFRAVLRQIYHLLPRSARPLVNDFKNALKNRL
jgi:hypothetical protein